jgi:DNA-directed RNA polymerase specialized sigma24 family protein
MTSNDQPERRRAEQELHERLLAGEEDASFDVFRRYLGPLLRRLEARFGSGPAARELPDVAHEILTRYILEPARYRGGGISVPAFLWMDAWGDTLNRLKKRRPVLQCELPLETESVAEDPDGRNPWRKVLGDIPGLPEGVTLEQVWARVRAVLPEPRDQEFVKLWLSGETGFETFVPLLELEELSRQEQQDAVSKVRDRIQKALRRIGKAFEDE